MLELTIEGSNSSFWGAVCSTGVLPMVFLVSELHNVFTPFHLTVRTLLGDVKVCVSQGC